MIDINLPNFNSFRLLTVFIKCCTVYIFGFLHSREGSIEFLSSVEKGHLKYNDIHHLLVLHREHVIYIRLPLLLKL